MILHVKQSLLTRCLALQVLLIHSPHYPGSLLGNTTLMSAVHAQPIIERRSTIGILLLHKAVDSSCYK